MPTDGRTQTYGFLEQLSTEQLLDLIRSDPESPEEGDLDLTIRILEVIEEREKKEPTGLLADAGQAWEDFQKYFNTPDGTGRPLYPVRDPESETAAEEKQDKRRRGRLLRRLAPVAAVVAVTFFSMIAAQAFGFDVFGALAQWTDETFHFMSVSAAGTSGLEAEATRRAVREAFDSCGITIPAPAWYPEGTKLAREIDVVEISEGVIVICEFTCGDKTFGIMAQQYKKSDHVPSFTFEKDALNVEEYSSNGRLFYIMSNLYITRAVYSNDETVFAFEGELSLEATKQIIDSIGE